MRINHWIIAALLAAGIGTATAATLNFVQTGFSGGGEVRFSITGADLNGDRLLEFGSATPDEVTGFAFHFTGNALVGPATLGFSDLLLLTLNLDTRSFLDPDAVIFAGNLTFAYIAGASAVGDCTDPFFQCGLVLDLGTDAASLPPLAVAQPAALAMMLVGLLGMLAVRRYEK
jgi:hypothetical protein